MPSRKLRRDLQLRVTPLLGLLKAEAASERVKMISQAVEISIKSVFGRIPPHGCHLPCS